MYWWLAWHTSLNQSNKIAHIRVSSCGWFLSTLWSLGYIESLSTSECHTSFCSAQLNSGRGDFLLHLVFDNTVIMEARPRNPLNVVGLISLDGLVASSVSESEDGEGVSSQLLGNGLLRGDDCISTTSISDCGDSWK